MKIIITIPVQLWCPVFTVLQCQQRPILQHPSIFHGNRCLSVTHQSFSVTAMMKITSWSRAHGGLGIQGPYPRIKPIMLRRVIKQRAHQRCLPLLPYIFLLLKPQHRWLLPNAPFLHLQPWTTRPALRRISHLYWRDSRRKTSSLVLHARWEAYTVTAGFKLSYDKRHFNYKSWGFTYVFIWLMNVFCSFFKK